MRKLILVILILFSLSCNSDKEAKYLIGVSQCSDDLWRQTMNNEMLREASFFSDIELEIKTVRDDTEQQIRDIEYFIDVKVDLLVVSPNESIAITEVVRKAYRAGIPVVMVDRKIASEDYTAYVGADNYQIGKEAGLYVVDVLKGRGNIVEMRGLKGATSDLERHNGFIEIISKYPDIKIIAEKHGNYLKDVAERQMAEVLKETENVDLVFAMNDPMALGVHDAAMKYSGKPPFIIGVDALPGEGGGIQNIQNGLQDASFLYPTEGDKVIDLAIKILKKEDFEHDNMLYTAVVDKSNVRVLLLQIELIEEHQIKLGETSKILNASLKQYSNQRMLFYGTILILLLITTLLIVSIFAYSSKSKSNRKLEEQKNQLISLSKQLEEATHAKLVFFTNISHEFRTPLTLILGPVETMLASGGLTSVQEEMLGLVKRNSNRLLGLISQIIEFRSYENGKMNTFFSDSDIKAFLENLNILFEDYAKRKDISFSFRSDNSDLMVCFDKEKVEKIYFNLLSNAFKNTAKKGQIEVSLSREMIADQKFVKLSVFNNGEFIPADKIKNIFDRFYKVTPNDSGAGIGLALVSVLVEVHNGKINVTSIENEGTTFDVLLPYNQIIVEETIANEYEKGYVELQFDNEAFAVMDNSILDNSISKDKPIVLIIEDNLDMRNYMRFTLQEDYSIIEAKDGDVGVVKSIKYIPDIIICDVMMPGKDGFEVCRLLKENVSTSYIPIILLTACTLDEQKAIGFESGADAYIPKPFNAKLLKIRLRKLIESRQKIRETFGSSLISDTKRVSIAQIEQDFIGTFQSYVEKNISDPELNIVEIASEMGMSRVQLYRKLKSLTNYSPNELVRIVRLKYAVQMIHSDIPIAEIAYQSGFSSASYFTKCFKEFYHVSPSDYTKGS